MGRTGVIVSLVVTAVLAVVAILTLRPATPTTSGAMLRFEPSQVVRLDVETPGGTYTLQRPAAPGDGPASAALAISPELAGWFAGEWWLVRGRSDGPGPIDAWPAMAERVHAALRLASDLVPTRGADGPPETPITLRVTLRDGATQSLRVSTRVLAGEAVAESLDAQGRVAGRGWIGAEFASMLSDVAAWRDPRALPGLGPETSRILLEGQAGRVALARVQGRWGVVEPIAEPAEPDAITRLVSRLSSIQIVEFDRDAAAPGGERAAPTVRVVVEADRRDGGSSDGQASAVSTLRRSLVVLGGRGLASRQAAAELELVALSTTAAPPAGLRREVTIAVDPLADVSLDAAAYVARRALGVPAAEVGAVTLRRADAPERRFTRTLDGWSIEGAPAPADERALVDQLLAMLTQVPAEAVSLEPSADAAVCGAVLETLGGAPLGSVEVALARDADGNPAAIHVRGPQVERRYTAAAAPELATMLARWPAR